MATGASSVPSTPRPAPRPGPAHASASTTASDRHSPWPAREHDGAHDRCLPLPALARGGRSVRWWYSGWRCDQGTAARPRAPARRCRGMNIRETRPAVEKVLTLYLADFVAGICGSCLCPSDSPSVVSKMQGVVGRYKGPCDGGGARAFLCTACTKAWYSSRRSPLGSAFYSGETSTTSNPRDGLTITSWFVSSTKHIIWN